MKSYNVGKINPETFLVDALDFFEISGLFFSPLSAQGSIFSISTGVKQFLVLYYRKYETEDVNGIWWLPP